MKKVKAANITVMVSDMDRSLDFYTGILGLSLKRRFGNHWAEVEAPGLTIGIHPTGEPVIRGNNLQIALGVDDLDAAVAELKEKGIQFKFNTEDRLKLAFFTDPDGNTLYFVQEE